jgi:hypothetical protein
LDSVKAEANKEGKFIEQGGCLRVKLVKFQLSVVTSEMMKYNLRIPCKSHASACSKKLPTCDATTAISI